MRVPDILAADRIACGTDAASKKRALETLAGLMAQSEAGLPTVEAFDSLLARERLGSTGLGHGVALPHGRIKGARQTIGAFLRLNAGVDYDAVDGEPVDLMFAMLVPEQSTDEHLQMLAQLAEMFSNPEVRQGLREADCPEAVLRIFEDWRPQA